GLAERQGIAVPAPGTDATALESIVLSRARPAMRVLDGTFSLEGPAWAQLEAQRENIQRAIAAVGRVTLGDGRVAGTGTLVGHGLLATRRGVIEAFTVGTGRNVALVAERQAVVDFRAEGVGSGDAYPITRIVLAHPYWDFAILEVDALKGRKRLTLETIEPPVGRDVVVIRHPSRTEEERALIDAVFDGVSEEKRVRPGKYVGVGLGVSYSRQVTAGGDDASTLGRDFGAAVIDPATGRLLGVRFVSNFLTRGACVPAWELARDPEIVSAGVEV